MRSRSTVALMLFLLTAPAISASDFGDLYQRVKSSVVVIETTQQEVDPATSLGLVSTGSLGSGVLVSRDGKVMTAAHVVQVADSIQVRFLSGEVIAARVLTSEPAADLALLQLERLPGVAQVAELGDSDVVDVGDEVFVIGAPLGMGHTLTVGHISARRREGLEVGGTMVVDQFQTDAAINQGNSGGPMFDMQGRVIGIVSYIISQGGGFEGLGFVITSNVAREMLLERRSIWSGVQGKLLTGELARIFNVPQSTGLLVERTADRSLATHIGLRGGDILATIGEIELVLGGDIVLDCLGISLDDSEFREKIGAGVAALSAGDDIVLRVLRAGTVVELKNVFNPEILIPQAPEL